MSKVKDWVACDLRYVGEAKLARLTDEELEELYAGLRQKHGKAPELGLAHVAQVARDPVLRLGHVPSPRAHARFPRHKKQG